MLKPADNPPVFSPWVSSLDELEGRWWVGHTKSRNEKAFAWDLHERQIGYVLPMQEQIKKSGGRNRRVFKPVFSSYVFFCGDADSRRAALETGRLCTTIDVVDHAQLIGELVVLTKALAAGARLETVPQLIEGQRCRVKEGPFEGIEGVVHRIGNATNIALRVSTIGQGALMEIDARLLEPLPDLPGA